MRRLLGPLAALLLALAAWPALAVEPGEMLADPVLEARARTISASLRCPVCLNESIDESNAPISHELRVLIRERLVAGDTDREVIDFVVARYGEFVLMRPDPRGANLILWIAGPAMLLIAGGTVIATLRRRAQRAEPEALTTDETHRLHEILGEDG
ncbi:MAG: cytochrome c-type biogenesis protein CcmH [Rubellimicrobium sp.]|nr:cytochrome c-type biogenesis protein CcmH [Rubellimicrobium sp.]